MPSTSAKGHPQGNSPSPQCENNSNSTNSSLWGAGASGVGHVSPTHARFEQQDTIGDNTNMFRVDGAVSASPAPGGTLFTEARHDSASSVGSASHFSAASSSTRPSMPQILSGAGKKGSFHLHQPTHPHSSGVQPIASLSSCSTNDNAASVMRMKKNRTPDAFGAIESESSEGEIDSVTENGRSTFGVFQAPSENAAAVGSSDGRRTEHHMLQVVADLLQAEKVPLRDLDAIRRWATTHHEAVGKKICELFVDAPSLVGESIAIDPITNTYRINVPQQSNSGCHAPTSSLRDDGVGPSPLSLATLFNQPHAESDSSISRKQRATVKFNNEASSPTNDDVVIPPALLAKRKSTFACNALDTDALTGSIDNKAKKATNSRKSLQRGILAARASVKMLRLGSDLSIASRNSARQSTTSLGTKSPSRGGGASLSPEPQVNDQPCPNPLSVQESEQALGGGYLTPNDTGSRTPERKGSARSLLSHDPDPMNATRRRFARELISSRRAELSTAGSHRVENASLVCSSNELEASSRTYGDTNANSFTLPSWSDRKQYATDDQAEENAEQARKTNLKSYHMLIVLAIMVFNFFVIPIRVGVGSDQFPSWFWALEVVIDVAAVVAAVMRLWLPVEDRGRVILDRAKIKEAYFQTQLKLDIFALFPLQLLLLPLAHAGVVSSVARDFARINRLLYLPAFSALFDDVAERWLAVLHPLVHRLMKFLFAFFAYVFITAAPMMMAFRQDVALGRQWMAIQNNDDGVDYGVVLFYAFGISAGRSFPNPNTETQMIVMLVISFFGMGSMAVIISGVTSLILSLVERSSKLLNKLQDASGQLKHMRMSDEITGEVLEYYELMFKQFNTFDYSNSEDMFDEIPFDLLQYLEDHINTDIIKSVTLFENVTDPKMIRAIASGLEMYVVMPGTVICREGDEGYDMYFMAKGAAVATFKHFPELNSELQEGDYFGQASLLYADVQHLTVVTKTVSQLFALGKEHFDRIVEAYPELLEPIVKSATELHERRAELMKQHEHNSNNASSASLAVPQLGESGNKHDAELRSSTHSDTGSSGQRESSSRRTLLESSVKSMSWKNSKSGRSMGSSSTTRNGRRLRGAAGVSNLQEAELLSQSLSSFVGQHRRDRGEKSSGNTKGRRLSLSKDTYSNSMSGSDRGFVVTVVKEQSPEAPMRGAGALGGQRNPLMGAPSRSSSPSLDSHHSDTLGPNQRTPRHSNTRDYSSGGKDDQKEFSLESANRSSSTITDDRRGTHVIKMQGDTKDDGFDNPFL